MIKLTKLCNKRRIEEERTPPENDFPNGCEFSFRKSYASGLAMCGYHASLRSFGSSHPASALRRPIGRSQTRPVYS